MCSETTSTRPADPIPLLVIGGGQAGLATGYHLKQRQVAFRILEAHDRVGDRWRKRYRSLTLFTPRFLSELPGLPLPGDPAGYASKDEFADYLETYARTFDLPVSTGARVLRLTQEPEGGFKVAVSNGETIAAQKVIVATGGFQIPATPKMSDELKPAVVQLNPETIGDGSNVPPGTMLVVGDGASGRDIAVEFAQSRRVILATGKPRKLFPERILGKSTWWWLRKFGLLAASSESVIGRIMRRADPFPDRDRNLTTLKNKGVEIAPRVLSMKDRVAVFADGREVEITSVVWAAGYRDDTTWMGASLAKAEGIGFVHKAGASPVANLFFVGRPWQRTRGSALIAGVGSDAEAIVKLAATNSIRL